MKPLTVTPTQAEAVDRFARTVIRFGLTLPAVLSLESMRPLSYVGSQFMHMLTPSIAAFWSPKEWEELARLLEDRRGLDYLIGRLEALDRETRGDT